MAIQIQITRDFTLRDIEKSLSDLASNTDSVATIWLPHDIGPKLFKDCRLVTLLLTASRGRKLVVKDWIRKSQWDSRKAIKRFGTEIEGLASLVYANAVGIADDNSVYPDRSSIYICRNRPRGNLRGGRGPREICNHLRLRCNRP